MKTEDLQIKIKVDTSGIDQAKKEISKLGEGAKGSAAATTATTESMRELKDSMEQIRNLEFAEILIDNLDSIKEQTADVTKNFKNMKGHLANFAEEFKGAFDFKNFDVDDGFKGYLDSSLTGVKESVTSLKSSVSSLGQAFKAMGATAVAALSTIYAKAIALIAVLASVVALTRNAFGVSALGKQMNVLAQQAGMSTDAYQKWAFVLGQIGLSVDDMIGAQQTLLEAQIDVREGAEDMIAAFQQIGLSQEQVLGMNQQQLYEATVAGLQGIENSTQRASLAYKLLSEDSKNLAPLLNMTAQEVATLNNNFYQLNGAMSKSLLEASNRLQASLGNLRTAWQGLKNTLAEAVLPVIITVVNWLVKAIAVVNMFLRAVFGMEIVTSSGGGGGLDNATAGVGGYTEAVETATGAVEKLKRTTMGFDELNIVQNPNSGGGGAGAGAGGVGGGGGFGIGSTDSLFNTEALDMSKWQEFFEKYRNLIQDITTWGLIGTGVGVAVLGALTGNIPMVLAGLTLAGIGFAIGNVEGGTFDRLREKFEELNLEIVPLAMIGIGAAGAVYAALTGNWPLAIVFAAMAGIGLATIGGGDGIRAFVDKYNKEIQGVVAPSMITAGIVTGVLGLLIGNIPVAAAGFALAAAGIAVGGLTNSGGVAGWVDEYSKEINRAVSVATLAVGILGMVACLVTGNIPGAVAFGVLAGISVANLATGGSFFKDATDKIKEVWADLKAWFGENVKPVFTKEWWANLFGNIKKGIDEKLQNVSDWFSPKWGAVVKWFQTNVAPKFTVEYWKNKFDVIRQGISTKLNDARITIMNAWNNIKTYFLTNIAPKFTLAYWQQKFNTIKAALTTKLGEVRITVMNVWNNIKSYFLTNIAPKFTLAYWQQKFEPIRSAASAKLTEARNTIMNAWNNIKKWFTSNVAPKFTVKYWTTKFNTIKDGAKAAFNGIISIVETAINSIIRKLNTISWKIPSYVPKYGGKKFGFDLNTVKIPRLATGGIAVNSTLANIGEDGAEAVLPLENNTGWMDLLADKIATRNQAPTKIVLKVGEKELGWASVRGINQITKQTGEVPLQIV